MIITRPFHKAQDTVLIRKMLKAHGLSVKFKAPKTGFVAFNGERVVAAGFLRRIEGGAALVDGLITNPECSPEDRDQAASCIIDALVKQAKLLKFKGLIANTVDSNTLLRSYKHGFVRLPHTLLAHSLRIGDS